MRVKVNTFELDMFRYNLAKYLEAHNYSVRAMAIESGIPIPTLSRYAVGDAPITVRALVQLAKTMNVSVDWLLGLTQSPSTELPPKTKKLIDAYAIASDSDKQIMDTIIQKYYPSTSEDNPSLSVSAHRSRNN